MVRSPAYLGAPHCQQSDYHLARYHFRRALDIDERALDNTHLLLCARLNDLGRFLKDLGDMNGSDACYDREAEILRANASDAEVRETVSQSA
ncbi:MAG TPA: tetratricopeptide repeat protein [Tepidisphaeraceae bacterium]